MSHGPLDIYELKRCNEDLDSPEYLLSIYRLPLPHFQGPLTSGFGRLGGPFIFEVR